MNIYTRKSMSFFLFLVITTFLADTHADPFDQEPPIMGKPPSDDTPMSYFCYDTRTKCWGFPILCPRECPIVGPDNVTEKSCYVDCNSPTCESFCKSRKPDCNGIGSACFDPRFVGGDGVMFYFHGKTNEHFSLVSDLNLQINARFIGHRPEGRSRDNTWIQALGIMFGSHTFTLSANKVAQWDNDVDQLFLAYDDMPISIKEGHPSTWSAPDYNVAVARTARCNSIIMRVPGVVEISVNVVPITKEDDRIHRYQIPSDDCFAHLEVQFKFLDLSEHVEGVLGQTYRPEYQSPVKRGVPMPIMGGEDKFKTSSLLSTDCKFCIFRPEFTNEAKYLMLDYSTSTINCTSKMSNGDGIICRR